MNTDVRYVKIVVEFMDNEPMTGSEHLADIAWNMVDGSATGTWRIVEDRRVLNRGEVVGFCDRVGSDPEFLLGEEEEVS